MLTNHVRAFIATWLSVALVLVIGAAGALGYNSISNSFSLIDGFSALGDMFGGLLNVAGILLLFAVVIAVFFGGRHIAKSSLGNKANHIGFASVAVLLVAAFIGINWITIDRTLWVLVVIILVVTVASMVIMRTSKKFYTTDA